MTVKYKVLEKIKKGEIVSGQELAEQLNVSRNSVWKAINSLRKDGYIIEGQTNSGYILMSEGDVLSVDSVKKHLKTDGVDLHVYETVTSTNTLLKDLAAKGYKEGTVIISAEQTAGKGRLGRKFESPKNTGIYVSLLLRPRFSASESLCVTTAAAVACAKTIEELSENSTKIKWVNDIYIDDRKVSGILTEASVDFESGTLDYAIVGIGINIKKPDGGFPEEIENIAGVVFEKNPPSEIRAKMSAKLIDNFFAIYNKLPEKSYMNDYISRSYLNGKSVTMTVGSSREEGTVVEINQNAELIVKLKNGEVKAFSAGEALISKKDD